MSSVRLTGSSELRATPVAFVQGRDRLSSHHAGMKTRNTVLAAAIAVCPALVPAQPRSLAGSWVTAAGEQPASLAPAPAPLMGTRFALAMEGGQVTLTRPMMNVGLVTTFALDGTRATHRAPARLCEGERQFHESMTSEGNALVFTSHGVTPAGGGQTTASESRRVMRLEGPDRLVVEGSVAMRDGSRAQVASVYRRTTDTMPPPPAALPATGIAATIDQVAWIGTTWRGTNGALTTEETWTPPASGGMMATARTLRGPALASFEFLCIAERWESLVYFAMPDARTPATAFVLTAVTPTSATFENPGHDFPRTIRYTRTADGGLETTIAGANGANARSVQLRKATP